MPKAIHKPVFKNASADFIARNTGYFPPEVVAAKKDSSLYSVEFTVKVEPMGAVRMNRSDSWRKRPVVVRYWAYKDAIKEAAKPAIESAAKSGFKGPPDILTIKAFVSMPKSWSKIKAGIHKGTGCRSKPDADNIVKGAADAMYSEDSGIWYESCEKRWCNSSEERLEIFLGWIRNQTQTKL